jgi:ATP-dependent protease HslVU (ClpYQ) peptidase subunit
MSCVVALKDHGSIYLASDSMITTDYGPRLDVSPKFHKLNDTVWFGSTGRMRFSQMMRHRPFNIRDKAISKDDVVEWVFNMRDNIPTDFKYQCLVVGNNSIYYFNDDISVTELEEKFFAIGSGAKYAMGVLEAIDAETSPLEKVRKAIAVAIKRDISCGGQIHTQIV